MANVMDLMASLGLDASKFEEGLNKAKQLGQGLGDKMQGASGKLEEFGKGMEKLGGNITKVGKAFAPMSAAAGAGLGLAIKTAAGFEAQMSKVQAISGVTGGDLEKLTAKAREMGATTKFSASEAGAAMEYMAMAGWKAEDMMGGIEGIMNLAAASGTDLATTSDIVTDALTGFGLAAEDSGHFADVLAAASSNANTNVEMMGETFKYAAPLAGALGYSVEDVAVATGLMANSGIKAGMAGTALRGWLTRLAKPTKESGAAMKALGISMTDSEGNMKSFMQIMEETRDAFQGLTEDEKAQYAAMLAGQNGMSGLLAVVNATEADMRKLSGAVDNADGSAKRMAETMQNNLNGQLTILKSGVEEAAISVGNALLPNIKDLVSKVQDAVNWFNNLDSATQSSVAQMLVFAAGIAPVTIALGTFISSVGTIVGALPALGAAFAALTSPVGLFVAAVGLISVALLKFNSDAAAATPAMEEFQRHISATATEIQNSKASIEGLGDSIKKSFEGFSSTGGELKFWRDELHKCFDETGNLKEGCEDLANHALQELNGAMGTDYSLAFITQAKDSALALGEIDTAVDSTIAKMKELAIQQAVSNDYAKALQEQASAQSQYTIALNESESALAQLKAATEELNAANNESFWTPGHMQRVRDASAAFQTATDNVNTTKEALLQAGENAGKAESMVQGLEAAMEELGKGGPDAADKAAQAYGRVGVEAEKAGKKGREEATATFKHYNDTFSVPLNAPKFNEQEASAHATETKDIMQGIVETPMQGQIDSVQGGDAAATTAHGEMQNIVGQAMTGNVGSVTGASAAASSAHAEMQSFMDRHPIVAKVVKTVVDDGSSKSYGGRSQKASGGFIFKRQDVTVGEAGPEVIIPLSANRRDRAINLFANAGRQLGVLSPMAENSRSGVGGIVVNAPITVYGAEGQNVEELAEAVSEHINRQITNSRRVWEGSLA